MVNLFVEFSLRFYPTHSMKTTRAFGANRLCLHSSDAVHDKGNTTSNWLFFTGGLQSMMSSLTYTTTQRLNFFFYLSFTDPLQAGIQWLHSWPPCGISTYEATDSFILSKLHMLRRFYLRPEYIPTEWNISVFFSPPLWYQAGLFIVCSVAARMNSEEQNC